LQEEYGVKFGALFAFMHVLTGSLVEVIPHHGTFSAATQPPYSSTKG
jgi:hypothetical protein